MPRAIGLLTFIGVWLVSPAAGREITVKVVPAEIDKVPYAVALPAAGATCAAVSDPLALVAVGHKAGKDGQVSLFRLDAQGKPTGMPIVLKLPKPAPLAPRETYPLSLVFHPTLPLLYVWQDVEGLKGDPVPPSDPAWKDLEHLLIYSLDGAAPELLLSLCRGAQFHTGNTAGSLGLDVAGGRLYVPNLRFGEKNPPESAAVGWFHLDGDGLPLAGDEEPAKAAPALDAAKAAAGRAGRVAALRTAVTAGKPVGAFRNTPSGFYGLHWWPCGAGYVHVSRDVLIVCGPFGPVTWNHADRRARAQVFLMPVNFVTYYCTRITGHPTLPVVFASLVGYSYAHRVEHADGFITLVPQILLIEGATLKSPAVVLTKRNLVAFGGPAAVYVVPLDAEGKFKAEAGTLINAPGGDALGLVYSEKFDRLYVAVEKPK